MKEKKPLIGITCSSEEGVYRLYMNYSHMVSEAGGNPVLLGYSFEGAEGLDGVIISGGGDINPKFTDYGDSPLLDCCAEERDIFEFALFKEARAKNLPILGICRGHQLINVALGGTLIRDIPEAGYKEDHMLGEKGFHPVTAEKGTLMHRVAGDRLDVWSTHHQAIRALGAGLRVTSFSDEGIIESVEHESGMIFGVQTHPERMKFYGPFEWLTAKARKMN